MTSRRQRTALRRSCPRQPVDQHDGRLSPPIADANSPPADTSRTARCRGISCHRGINSLRAPDRSRSRVQRVWSLTKLASVLPPDEASLRRRYTPLTCVADWQCHTCLTRCRLAAGWRWHWQPGSVADDALLCGTAALPVPISGGVSQSTHNHRKATGEQERAR